MNIEESLNKIYSLSQFSMKFGLEGISLLLRAIGNPQRSLNCLHVAGTNGKGSTASFAASILQEAGYTTGLYTSPHLVRFNERIRVNGQEIPDLFIADFVSEVLDFIEKNRPTFFEITTALCFKYFNDMGVDCAVIETGLGGRLDSTNVLDSAASVITSISLDHSAILGRSIKEIACEKAGIIKTGKNVFIGPLPEEAQTVIKGVCLNKGSKLFRIEDRVKDFGDHLLLEDPRYNLYQTPLRGHHQRYNACLAMLAVSETFGVKDFGILNSGVLRVRENSGYSGRYEVMHKNPMIIFDAGHNPEGVESFAAEFQKEEGNYVKKLLLFGAMKDKDIEGMLRILGPHFDEFYFTQVSFDRAAVAGSIRERAEKLGINGEIVTNPAGFVEKFKKDKENYCLVVIGSIYLLGLIKSQLHY